MPRLPWPSRAELMVPLALSAAAIAIEAYVYLSLPEIIEMSIYHKAIYLSLIAATGIMLILTLRIIREGGLRSKPGAPPQKSNAAVDSNAQEPPADQPTPPPQLSPPSQGAIEQKEQPKPAVEVPAPPPAKQEEPEKTEADEKRNPAKAELSESEGEERGWKPPSKQVVVQPVISDEVGNKISAVESELRRVREEMKATIDDLKSTIFELRASISEIGNPFNYLRKYGEVLGLKSELENLERSLSERLAGEPCPKTPGVQLVLANGTSKNGLSEKAGECASSPHASDEPGGLGGSGMQAKRASGADSTQQGLLNIAVSALNSGATLGRLLKAMRWVGEMLSTVGKENLLQLIDFYESAGLISSANKVLLYNMVDALTSPGLSLDDHLLAVYKLAKTLGLSDSEADAEVLKMMTERRHDGSSNRKSKSNASRRVR